MKKSILASFFVLGLTSIIAQLAVIREAIINFYGNELFIGLVLGFWLIWVALGSIILGRAAVWLNSFRVLIFCHLLIPFFFLFEIILLRMARLVLAAPCQTPNLILSCFYLILVTAPLCLLLGLQFAVAGRCLTDSGIKPANFFSRFFSWLKNKFSSRSQISFSYLISQGYFYEVLGLVSGGLVYSLILAFLDSLDLFLLVIFVNFLALYFFINLKVLRLALVGLLILLFSVWVIPDVHEFLVLNTNGWRYPNQQFIKAKNSIYGNIAITQIGNQFNFYESGLFVGSTGKDLFKEEIIHLPLLHHPQPETVLLVGNGLDGSIQEILKYPVQKVFYLELDSKLIETVEPYLLLELIPEHSDERVDFIFQDSFCYIKEVEQKFDVIIINLPNPSTALLNRFYTFEFFEILKTKLNPHGLAAISLDPLADYYSPELKNLAVTIYNSLNKSFFFVSVLPDKNLLYLASDKTFNYQPQDLIERLEQYNLDNELVTKDYINYRLDNDRIAQTLNIFKENESARINTNGQPVGYWHQNLFWLSLHHPWLAGWFNFLSWFNLTRLIITSLILFFGLYWVLDVLVKRRERILVAVTAVPEFSLLSAEVAFIFIFQTVYGYLYYQLGLIFTIILLGIACGVYLANNLAAKNKIQYCHLFRLYFSISLYFIFLALIIKFYPEVLGISLMFYGLVFITGFLGGMEFPIVNKYYFRDKIEPNKKTSTIYGADLLGSALGAILAGIFLLPVLGLSKTFIFLAFLNFLAFVALFFLRQDFEEK